MALAVMVLTGFGAALVVPWLRRAYAWPLATLTAGAVFAYFLAIIPEVSAEESVHWSAGWAPSLGISLAFRVDGLALLFALLISGVGALVALYAGSYLGHSSGIGRFYAYLLAFMASMLGLVCADDLVTLFVFWELTSITSFLLIGFEEHRPEARKAAVQALLVTGGGGLALLAGLVLIGIEAGSYRIEEVLARGEAVRESGLYLPILLLVAAGAFTKSAQFPFHFWLPGAMAAPTPVSAYLHSATMVKAGVYLLARLHPALSGTDEWTLTLVPAGAVTMVLGAFIAVHQTDLKLILAYSTVSALGILVLLLGIGSDLAVKAMAAFLLGHALYKGGLFLVAGIIDHETGTRDIRELGGLLRKLPRTASAAAIGTVSLAGIPPVFAFIGKETFLDSVLHWDNAWRPLLMAAVVVAAALSAVVAGLVAKPFAGALRAPRSPHEAPWPMLAGPVLLGGASLTFGLAPILAQDLVRETVASIAGRAPKVSLALWHGFNLPLLLSGVSIGGGAALLAAGPRLVRFTGAAAAGRGLPRPSAAYEASLTILNRVALEHTRALQHGYLRIYLAVVLAASAALVVAPLAIRGGMDLSPEWNRPATYEAMIAGVVLAGAGTAVASTSRLTAVVALGLVGFGVALIYALFGAPDLALTQFLVETLTVLLFVLVFYRLPRVIDRSRSSTRLRDAVLAVGFGSLMTLLVLASLERSFAEPISAYFAENSATAAVGRNVVNVILVDFRALDTLGEIVVLAVAALGVLTLLRLRRGGER